MGSCTISDLRAAGITDIGKKLREKRNVAFVY